MQSWLFQNVWTSYIWKVEIGVKEIASLQHERKKHSFRWADQINYAK